MTESEQSTLLGLGQIASWAHMIDLDVAEELLRTNPGPEFYTETLRATIEFCRTMQSIQQRLGHQRAEIVAEMNIAIGNVKGSA
jgi:hypothetical protein